ncbi:MAG: hypothetical protein G01um101438_695 [Parcubacteria group bacterium Gr01-1014_38]|nr:MAG: hypothetical protein G01um101438_695 [Parcubacteria group bacterium Gr01-1014_38]
MTTQLRTPIHVSHHRLLRKMEASSGLPKRTLVERALELLAENVLRDPKARALLNDIQQAESDLRAGRTLSLPHYERSRGR